MYKKDLGTIERKVSHNEYKTFEDFVDDVQLVFDNARLYNPEESVYYKNANQVELDFKALLNAKWHWFLYTYLLFVLVYIALGLSLIMALVSSMSFENLCLLSSSEAVAARICRSLCTN